MFTVLADVAAAFLLVSAGPYPLGRFVCVLLAGVALYWAGMILNDVFDVDVDRARKITSTISGEPDPAWGRPSRLDGDCWFWESRLARSPVMCPSSLGTTWLPTTWLPGAIAVALAVMIVAYDGPLKKTPLAPAAMGSCRVLSFLLGASPVLVVQEVGPVIPNHVLLIALGFGIYIMGVTTMARREAVGGRDPRLLAGLIVLIFGVALLALAPRLAGGTYLWKVNPDRQFPILVAMVAFPVIVRGFRAVRGSSATADSIHDQSRRALDHSVGGDVRDVGRRAGMGVKRVCFGYPGDLAGLAVARDLMLEH